MKTPSDSNQRDIIQSIDPSSSQSKQGEPVQDSEPIHYYGVALQGDEPMDSKDQSCHANISGVALQGAATLDSKDQCHQANISGDAIQGHATDALPKRQLFQENSVACTSGSPEKNMRTSSTGKEKLSIASSNVDDGHGCNIMQNSESTMHKGDDHGCNKKDDLKLSSMLHRKRALKLPGPLATPSMSVTLPPRKLKISALEKDIFTFATKRVKGQDTSFVIARIGRYFVTHGELGDSMLPTNWLISSTMDVYCEALNYDAKIFANPKLSKCFLTSEIVHKLKTEDADLDPATVGFTLNDCDMIMIPICHCSHWWVMVANIRDCRFDVLSSLKLIKEQQSLNDIVRTNFERLFQSMDNGKRDVDFSRFSLEYQVVPQQATNHGCGIYSMEFMGSWDGRRVAPVDNVTKVIMATCMWKHYFSFP